MGEPRETDHSQETEENQQGTPAQAQKNLLRVVSKLSKTRPHFSWDTKISLPKESRLGILLRRILRRLGTTATPCHGDMERMESKGGILQGHPSQPCWWHGQMDKVTLDQPVPGFLACIIFGTKLVSPKFRQGQKPT